MSDNELPQPSPALSPDALQRMQEAIRRFGDNGSLLNQGSSFEARMRLQGSAFELEDALRNRDVMGDPLPDSVPSMRFVEPSERGAANPALPSGQPFAEVPMTTDPNAAAMTHQLWNLNNALESLSRISYEPSVTQNQGDLGNLPRQEDLPNNKRSNGHTIEC
jgi:hypothetical protein